MVAAVVIALSSAGAAAAVVGPPAPAPGPAGEWALGAIGAPAAWARGMPGGPVVAIVDGGVDLSHPALAGRAWANPGEVAGNGVDDDGNGLVDDTLGWDFLDGDGDPSPGPGEPTGHATHVAGLVAGAGVGVNPGARLMVLRVCNPHCPVSVVATALRYAVAHGARVVNMSLGAPESGISLTAAIAEAEAAGVLILAAAGNGATDADATPFAPATDASGAILAVTATDATGALAPFANWGPASVDVAAPGEGVIGIVPTVVVPSGYAAMLGTSASAALVSGAASLVMAQQPGLGSAEVRSLLIATARRTPSLDGRIASGGVVDLAAATRAASAASAAATIAPATPCRGLRGAARTRCRANAALTRALTACRRQAPAARADCRVRARARHARALVRALHLR